MNTIADSLDSAASPVLEVADGSVPEMAGGLLPFGFSKTNQVVLECGDRGLVLSYVGKLHTDTLLEVRRAAGTSFSVEEVDEATFQLRLSGVHSNQDSPNSGNVQQQSVKHTLVNWTFEKLLNKNNQRNQPQPEQPTMVG